ncbi:hypothetical protein HZ326_17311 [Fusarium oxysporum f. sp. albedinis]|nr:hypothetical protein HZ326_17311 [Fusarium oxysporum f. sp. albedinis]
MNAERQAHSGSLRCLPPLAQANLPACPSEPLPDISSGWSYNTSLFLLLLLHLQSFCDNISDRSIALLSALFNHLHLRDGIYCAVARLRSPKNHKPFAITTGRSRQPILLAFLSYLISLWLADGSWPSIC